MRSSRSARALAALAALAACSPDDVIDPRCEASFLRYDNFGAPFLSNWCRACHSATVPPDMRQQAPDHVNFDTPQEVRAWSPSIERLAGEGVAMPPAGGPSAAERAMLTEWLRCGAP